LTELRDLSEQRTAARVQALERRVEELEATAVRVDELETRVRKAELGLGRSPTAVTTALG